MILFSMLVGRLLILGYLLIFLLKFIFFDALLQQDSQLFFNFIGKTIFVAKDVSYLCWVAVLLYSHMVDLLVAQCET